MYCHIPVQLEIRKKYSKRDTKLEGVRVATYDFEKTVRNICKSRNDQWSQEVLERIESILSDLPASDCVYLKQCDTNFRTSKSVPKIFGKSEDVSSSSTLGCHEDMVRKEAFTKTCAFFEGNDEEQFALKDLELKMKDYLSSSNVNPCSHVYMKQKLREYYSDSIVISESKGKSSIVTLRSIFGEILREYHSRSQNLSPEEHKKEILKAAAKFIKSDIKSSSFNTDRETYCKLDDFTADSALESLPESLQYLCREMFVGKLNERKVAAIGQSIMQCVRHRAVVAPPNRLGCANALSFSL